MINPAPATLKYLAATQAGTHPAVGVPAVQRGVGHFVALRRRCSMTYLMNDMAGAAGAGVSARLGGCSRRYPAP